MPLPEGYLPRKGDVLVLHGHVAYDVDESDLLKRGEADEYQVFIRLDGDYDDRRIPLKTVIDVFLKTWEAGDRVVIDGDDEGGSGEVIAVHENLCWIKYERPGREPSYGTYPASVLNAAPKDPVDEPFFVTEGPVAEPPPRAPSTIEDDGTIKF